MARSFLLFILCVHLLTNTSTICMGQGTALQQAKVKIVFMSLREPLPSDPAIKSFRNSQTGVEYASKFGLADSRYSGGRVQNLLAQNIPYGTYVVTVSSASEQKTDTRVISVNEDYLGEEVFSFERSKAHVLAVDIFGNPLKDAKVIKALDDFGTDYAGKFDKTMTGVVPMGIYSIEVSTPHGKAVTKTCFCESEAWAVLGIEPYTGDSDYPFAAMRVHGRVLLNSKSKVPVTIQLFPGYRERNTSMSAVVDPAKDESFWISGTNMGTGDFVTVVSQSGTILGTFAVRLPILEHISKVVTPELTIELEPVQ